MKKAFLLFLFLSFFKVFSQQNDFKNFNGKWKLSGIHSYNDKTKIYFSEILVIENNQICFSKSQNAENVNLNFQLLVHPEKYIDNQFHKMIKLENGEIWELEFREINNQKRIIWKYIKDSEGDFWIQLDERSIIRDSEKRKKALEGEINTYYTKIE